MWVVAWAVRRHKLESCLFHGLLGRHCQCEVSVLASSEVRRHGRRIPNYQSMYIDQSFSCRFSVDLWKGGRQEIREDSLYVFFCPEISSHNLVGIDSRFVPWYNSSNLLKARFRPTKLHWHVELKVD